jgi:cellulose synthase/poly-beta-1,6-N-acetylglucosamine synthase-like glycosyltransferase
LKGLFISFYFFLLFYIAIYGVGLYWMIWLYKRRSKPLSSPKIAETAINSDIFPFITIQLPIYNERKVVARLISSVAAFDWPRDRLEIQVLDDSDDDTTEIITGEVGRLRQSGISIDHIRRESRRGFKAGALAYGLERARGEFIAVFDADNLPRSDFIRSLIGRFDNPELGMVQARWSFINRQDSLLCRAQALFLDAHFFIEQSARSRGGLFMNFNGTAGIWRRRAIDEGGGWQGDTLTEDLDLSYRVQLAGWKMILDEDIDVPTELPSSIRSFKTQQYRWARGAIETSKKLLPVVMRSKLPLRIKLASLLHLTQKSVSLAILLLTILLIPALYIRLEVGMMRLLLVDLPIFIAGTGSMSIFYGLAYKREHSSGSLKDCLTLPILSSLGIALAVQNSMAVLAGLFSNRRTFIRTPKSGTNANEKTVLPPDYRIKFDHSVKMEAVLAGYSILAIAFAAGLKLYFSIPFLTTFAFGFIYFTFRSMREHYA